ncbi:hypothetical protein N7540_010984 [Penicillium herquei]|nr:hypothetical protein N7540_012979 [Penicillium herquei]KAJ6016393.1 hypothetical protein N7540_010984 [Penicillium herquei]
MGGKSKLPFLRQALLKRDHPRDSNRSPFPFISSLDEQLVWKWDQIKLCGRMLNVILPCIYVSLECPPNVPDTAAQFVKFSKGQVIVQRPAHLASLGTDGYHVGIRAQNHAGHSSLILLGLHEVTTLSLLLGNRVLGI